MNAVVPFRRANDGRVLRADTKTRRYRAVEPEMAALMLDGRGLVCDCSRACEALFKYRRSELVWRHVSLLLPQLAALELMQNGQINPRLRFLCHIGRHYQAVTQAGDCFASELFFNLINGPVHDGITLIVRPAQMAASSP